MPTIAGRSPGRASSGRSSQPSKGRQLHALLQAHTQFTGQTRNLAGQLARLTREIHDHVVASSSVNGRALR